ncbi:TlpA family protein disulfide reductase [candidate division KSB1 bacterium]|nr:TlpA family protein disulfide reductase [candidate division KSB1 bacterium]
MKYSLWFLLLPLLIMVNGGCTKKSTTVIPIEKDALTQLIGQRHGKVLLINVWATWCVPCREEFPDLVEIRETYSSGVLDMIGISADYSDEIDTKILPFLEMQGSNFKNYVQSFPSDEMFINFMNPDWNGALPATFIYDTNGHLIKFLEGKQTFDDFKRAIDNALHDA